MIQLKTFINGQYHCPTGLVGRAIGKRMVQQHEPEMHWTIEQLAIKPTDRILEIGFGAGKAIECVADQTIEGHIAGIDLSSTMVRVASRRNAQHIRAGHVDLRQGDVMALPFADQEFDKVFSIHTFYFWSDSQHALQEIFRVLKPGGALVLTLSPGTIKPDGERVVWPVQATLEEQVLPGMKRIGFTDAYLVQGPNSRQYITVAVIGTR